MIFQFRVKDAERREIRKTPEWYFPFTILTITDQTASDTINPRISVVRKLSHTTRVTPVRSSLGPTFLGKVTSYIFRMTSYQSLSCCASFLSLSARQTDACLITDTANNVLRLADVAISRHGSPHLQRSRAENHSKLYCVWQRSAGVVG